MQCIGHIAKFDSIFLLGGVYMVKLLYFIKTHLHFQKKTKTRKKKKITRTIVYTPTTPEAYNQPN